MKLSSIILALLLHKAIPAHQKIKNLQKPGECSHPEKIKDFQINKIKAGDWYPYGLTKVRDIYLSPFFNPYESLNCLKFQFINDIWFQQIRFKFQCNKNQTGEQCNQFEFQVSKDNQFQYIGQETYDCHADLKMMNITIIGTDYDNFMIFYGCYQNDAEGHTIGIYVLVSSYLVPKTVEENIFKILNTINFPINDSSYFEILEYSNKTKDCDCSMECEYEVCFGNYSNADFAVAEVALISFIQIDKFLSSTEISLMGIGFSVLLITNLILIFFMNSFNVEVYIKNK